LFVLSKQLTEMANIKACFRKNVHLKKRAFYLTQWIFNGFAQHTNRIQRFTYSNTNL